MSGKNNRFTTNLSREDFRQKVFELTGGACAFHPEEPAVDAHHIYERRLWPNGGYHLGNGIPLCQPCHLKAERCQISVESCYLKLSDLEIIQKPPIMPPCLEQFDIRPFECYITDKWGGFRYNLHPNNGSFCYPGPLYHQMKDNGAFMWRFNHPNQWTPTVTPDNPVKYPRTFHLPWSPGLTNEDRKMPSIDFPEEILVTEKMDGENTTLYNFGFHARSVNYLRRSWRNRMEKLWEEIRADIPDKMRICGENLFAKHSIRYENLPSFFLVFSVWENDVSYSWDDTVGICDMLGLKTVPVLFRGRKSELSLFPDITGQQISKLNDRLMPKDHEREGYVIRPLHSFTADQFSTVVGKYVRPNHVQTDIHWSKLPVERNGFHVEDE